MFDDDGVLFNPFMIGTAEDCKRYEYKQPTYVTYPYEATNPTQNFNKTFSNSTLAKQRNAGAKEKRVTYQTIEEKCMNSPSQLGEVSFSQAIKKDMAAAKKHFTNDRRIYAGRSSKKSESEQSVGSGTVRTLMAVRSPRLGSQAGVNKSTSSLVMAGNRQTSNLSLQSHFSKNAASKLTLKETQMSLQSHGRKRVDSKISLKKTQPSINTAVDPDIYSNVSHSSLRSKARVISGDDASRHSDRCSNASRISACSLNSRNSRKTNSRPIDEDTKSTVSIRSKTNEHLTERLSRTSRVLDENQTPSNSRPSLKEVADSLQSELAKSMETTKALSLKAAELSERLSAGNESDHRRFHTLIRQYTKNEPLKRCREDRMALWFKDAVLS